MIEMKYPIGIQSFTDIRTNDYVYVDKTALVYQLVNTGKYYFLSRPRRFGKSLLVSTLEAYFLGKKELFKGLAIEKLETQWKKHPVFHIDLNMGDYVSEETLTDKLHGMITDWEQIYGQKPGRIGLSDRFEGVIERAYEQTNEKVVILVDEYDKPLLEAIDNPALQTRYRSILGSIYGAVKSKDFYISFGLFTGVTKFRQVSVFSGFNNLNDISMDEDYADLCGISEKELHEYFEESIKVLATANNLTYEEACEKLREQYDGYHFCENTVGIYNPFSLLNTFLKKKFKDYWFKTATPSFLIKLMQKNDYNLDELEGMVASSDTLDTVFTETENANTVALLYQSGYLTIKDYDEEEDEYVLGFPNKEVERGFVSALVPYYAAIKEQDRVSFFSLLTKDVKQGRPDDFMQRLQTMLAANDYRVAGDKELYFQNTIRLIFWMLGFKVDVERATGNGRMDFIIKTKDYIYILEFKLDHTAEEALQQIKDKQYARPFQMDPRKLYLIGVNFSSETRTIEKWIIE